MDRFSITKKLVILFIVLILIPFITVNIHWYQDRAQLTVHYMEETLHRVYSLIDRMYTQSQILLKSSITILSRNIEIGNIDHVAIDMHQNAQIATYLRESFSQTQQYEIGIIDTATLQVIACEDCLILPYIQNFTTGIVQTMDTIFSMVCEPIMTDESTKSEFILCGGYDIGQTSIFMKTIREGMPDGVQAIIGPRSTQNNTTVNVKIYPLDNMYSIAMYTYNDIRQPAIRKLVLFISYSIVFICIFSILLVGAARHLFIIKIRAILKTVDTSLQKEESSSISIGDTTQWNIQRDSIRDELTILLRSVQRYRHLMQITHNHIMHHNVMFKLLYHVESTFSKEGEDENIVITSSIRRAMNVFGCECIRLCIEHKHHMANLCVVGICKNCIQECKFVDIDDCIAHQTTKTHTCHKGTTYITTILGNIQQKKACCIFESEKELSHMEMTAAEIFVTQLMLAISRLRERIAIMRERNIFLSGDVVIFKRSLDWTIIDITSNVIDQFGIHPNVILQKDYQQFVVEQDIESINHFQNQCLVTCMSQSITYRIKYQESLQYVYEHLQYIPEDNTFIGYILNITESIMTNQSLVQLRLAVESMNVGVCISNKHGIITYINTYEAEQHGYDVEQLIGVHVSFLGPERLRAETIQYIPQDSVRETVNIHRNGKEYPVLLRTSCMYDTMTNEYLGKVVVSENLTLLRQRERKLQQRNEELNSMSRTLAHDLASPANWIAEASEILLTEYSTSLPQDAKDLLSLLHKSANQQVKVISSARMIVKAGGKMDIKPIDSMKPIQWGIDQLNGKAKHITFKIPPCTAIILADSIQLGRVFQNLIDNSYKYRVESRPVIITITRTIVGRMLQYSVRDNGQGMSEEFLKQAGTLFARGIQDDSGMGVGLSFVKKIIHRHHGKFIIRSKEGVGTNVIFTVPLSMHDTE